MLPFATQQQLYAVSNRSLPPNATRVLVHGSPKPLTRTCATQRTFQHERGTITSTSSYASPDVSASTLGSNLQLLQELFPSAKVQELRSRCPDLDSLDLAAWHAFFTGYGVPRETFWKIIRYNSHALLGNTPHNAGQIILCLKQLGWQDEDVASRILPCYSHILKLQPADLEQVVSRLEGLGVLEGRPQLERMLQSCPAMLLPDFADETWPILERIQRSRSGKYANSGSYHI